MPGNSAERRYRRAALNTERSAANLYKPVRSGGPGFLVLMTLFFTFLPILLLVVLSLATIGSFVRGTGATGDQVLTSLPFLAAVLAAVVTGVLLRRAETNRRAWAMSVCTVALLLVAAFPPAYSFGKAMAEELCESAPGGRGYSGAPNEPPGICHWARS